MRKFQSRRWVATAVACLALPATLRASDQPALSKEQIKQFLLTAEVVRVKPASKGTSNSSRLTLSDGKLTHDAHFEEIDEHKSFVRFETGGTETNFVDSYKYNIAAYQLAELVGLDDLLPVYVERKWKGKVGSLGWWLPVMMDDQERYLRNIQPPNQDEWNRQIYKVLVFNQLVYDTDANLTNILIGNDWKIWRIDFTRAFRPQTDLQAPKNLVRCDRQLLTKLKALDGNELVAKTKGFLTKPEADAVMARRDKIVAHFQELITEKGEDAVLY